MKRSSLLGLVFAMSLAMPASAAPAGTTTICHMTDEAPFQVTITVSDNALPAHFAHGDTVGVCGPPTRSSVQFLKTTVPADGSLWSFVLTNGNDVTYQTWTDQPTPFNSGVKMITNPTAIEIDEWAGTGFDIAAYTPAVACTDNGVPLTPIAATTYDYGGTTRFYVYFSIEAGHAYVCTFTNTRIASTLYDVTGNAGAFACATGVTDTSEPTASSVIWRKVGTDIQATIHLDGAMPSSTFDVWIEQNPGTCPPGTSIPSNPAAITTNASGDGTATLTFTPVGGATNFWLTLWTPAGPDYPGIGAQVLRTVATIPLP